jgi:hypothetical protein
VIPNNKPEPDPTAGRNAHPEQEMITEHLAGRRINGNNGNNGDSEDKEAGRMIVEEDNDDDNAMTEVNQDPPMALTLSPNVRSPKSRKVANATKELQGYYNPLAKETLDKAREPAVIETKDDATETKEEVAGIDTAATLTSDPGEPQTFRQAVEEPAKNKWIPSTTDKVLDSINRDARKQRERTPVAGECEREQWLNEMIQKRSNIDILGKLKQHLGVWRTWHKDKDGET